MVWKLNCATAEPRADEKMQLLNRPPATGPVDESPTSATISLFFCLQSPLYTQVARGFFKLRLVVGTAGVWDFYL